MQDLLRGMVLEVVVESILHELNGSTDAVEIKIIGEIFHAVGLRGLSLGEALPRALREQFHAYLISAMATILTKDDPYGQVKAYFATVLAQVGDVSDLPEMERLIAADLERVRAERAGQLVCDRGGGQSRDELDSVVHPGHSPDGTSRSKRFAQPAIVRARI